MTNRTGLYALVFIGTLAALNAESNSFRARRLLEKMAVQDNLHVENIFGDSLPESFYVRDNDTSYVKIDGIPIRQIRK